MKVVKEFQTDGIINLKQLQDMYNYSDLYILIYAYTNIYSLVELNRGKVRLQDLYGSNLGSESYTDYIDAITCYLEEELQVEIFKTEHEYYQRLIDVIQGGEDEGHASF